MNLGEDANARGLRDFGDGACGRNVGSLGNSMIARIQDAGSMVANVHAPQPGKASRRRDTLTAVERLPSVAPTPET
jgi:hypothetical protein